MADASILMNSRLADNSRANVSFVKGPWMTKSIVEVKALSFSLKFKSTCSLGECTWIMSRFYRSSRNYQPSYHW